jgi:Kef-type K+ transport system membrane component KefB
MNQLPGGVEVFRDLFIVFVLARGAGEIFVRLRQPALLAEILVGVLIGPHALGWVRSSGILSALAQIGIVFLLFQVGLENRLSDLREVGTTAATVAVSGVVVPFALGFGLLAVLGHSRSEALFAGAALVASSASVASRVIRDLGMLGEPESKTILGAAVIDDVLGLLVLAVVAETAHARVGARNIAVLVAEAAVFLLLVATVGTRIVRRVGPELSRLRLEEGPFVVGVAACLGLAALARSIGLAGTVGAFLAGMLFAEVREHYDIRESIRPVTNFLTPFFFVVTGMEIVPRSFTQPATLALLGAVFILAVVGKVVPGTMSSRRFGRRGALIVGVGMVPRAEVGIIVASLGLTSGVIGHRLYAVVVSMSALTWVLTPPVLRSLFRDRLASR